jgi:prepilin-type N-terminal cleavage/methylation domain-containing protein/prepilin-type processing-associated H-X9-DG protein
MRQRHVRGFTLVELLVVIGIIALLIGILLPTLSRVQEQSRIVKCSANLRSIGQGFATYLAENQGVYPPAYVYIADPGRGAPDVGGGTAATPKRGYRHWSWFIYSSGSKQNVPEAAFTCPSLPEGGLPPTNPAVQDLITGQQRDPQADGDAVDEQIRRLAYTVNEAIMPRNKFNAQVERAGAGGFFNQFVRASQVRNSSGTILATEFGEDWRLVSEPDSGEDNVVKSHRPVHAFRARNANGSVWNLTNASPDPLQRGFPDFERVTPGQLTFPPASGESRLNWIGRNHGRAARNAATNPTGRPKSNFLYADGHVETKLVEETLSPKFEWGEKIWSLRPNGIIEQ